MGTSLPFDFIIGSLFRIPGSFTSSLVTGFENAFRISSSEGIALAGVGPAFADFFSSTTRGRSGDVVAFAFVVCVLLAGVAVGAGAETGVATV